MNISYAPSAIYFINYFQKIANTLNVQVKQQSSQPSIFFYSFQPPPDIQQKMKTHRVVYISGEPTNSRDRPCHLIIDTKTVAHQRPPNVPFVFMPYFALAFFSNGISHRPTELIKPANYATPVKSKFCAFMYSYDVPHRVRLFDLISRYKRVDGLGKSRHNVPMQQSRQVSNYVDDAVNRYRPYKFVIACENTISSGYVTEKLVVPMLAGCIPIYFGAPDVLKMGFNPKSFINMSSFPSWEAGLEYIKKVDQDPALYASILAEPWFIDNKLPDYFDVNHVVPAIQRLSSTPAQSLPAQRTTIRSLPRPLGVRRTLLRRRSIRK